MTTKKKTENLSKYKCTVCGHIYDPDLGEPDSGIDPLTPWNEVPESWLCPVCSVPREEFERIKT